MNLTEVKRQLDKLFSAPPKQGAGRTIVFWYDESGTFDEDIDTLDLENSKIIKLYDNNMFATKLYIEEKDHASNLLVYSPMPRPDDRDNWLTDTIQYSQLFSTDETSIHMLNLGIENNLRHVVERYKQFFRNNERFKKFASYRLAPWSETRIDVGVLSVLSKLPVPNFDNVARELLMELSQEETGIIDSISKFGNVDVLWGLIRKSYGYPFEDRNIEKLAIVLFVTHLSSNMNGKMPKTWESYVSTNTNCVVFIDNFMKNTEHFDRYKRLSELAADKLGLNDVVKSFTIDDIMDCDTFEVFDHSIILRIQENINLEVGEYEKYRRIINHRRNKRFFAEFENEYTVLLAICEFFILVEKYKDLSVLNAEKMFDHYVKDYYKIDTCYRKIILFSDKLENSNHDFMLTEQESFLDVLTKVENTYTNWFLNELSVGWCNLLDDPKWHIQGVTPQQNFYDQSVRGFVADNERIIVVISDGLRYESAVELTDILNVEQKGTVELSTMLGVIPSYTKLGMASLLPHKSIEITDKAEVLVDGISSQGTENREKILQEYKTEAVAITYENMIALSKDKAKMKEKFNGAKLIYIYHNTIDARGDHGSTEREVFDATEKSFAEISSLIRMLKNSISAINIYITADHGYIYKRSPLTESDKTPKEFTGSIEKSRRFFLSKENMKIQGTQCFSCDYLKGTKDLYAIIPRGINCYKVQGGGSGYVHGGSSLQEVVIPLIKFKSDKNASKSMGAKKVTVGLTSLSKRLTNVITYLTFFQYEVVEEKALPVRIKAYFIDDKGDRISNENIIIAESTSINPEDRTYKEKFTLKNMQYDKSKEYFLVLEDEDEMVNKVYEKIPFIIDLVFGGIKF